MDHSSSPPRGGGGRSSSVLPWRRHLEEGQQDDDVTAAYLEAYDDDPYPATAGATAHGRLPLPCGARAAARGRGAERPGDGPGGGPHEGRLVLGDQLAVRDSWRISGERQTVGVNNLVSTFLSRIRVSWFTAVTHDSYRKYS